MQLVGYDYIGSHEAPRRQVLASVFAIFRSNSKPHEVMTCSICMKTYLYNSAVDLTFHVTSSNTKDRICSSIIFFGLSSIV